MTFPFAFHIFGHEIYLHFFAEFLAFFLGYRCYVWEKKRFPDFVDSTNRLYAILGAAIGALVGSRLIGSLENPEIFLSGNLLNIFQSKTIIGGIFGGLIGVEITKKIIGEKTSTGDLFILPLILGIAIGRIGCFSMGVFEFTYGNPTDFFLGMNLGDSIKRHPTSLYEIIFLAALFPIFYSALKKQKFRNGVLFKIFMLAYFGFRFLIEFIKPNEFYVLGLSVIQWVCVICWVYYAKFILSLIINPKKRSKSLKIN
ncbi:MAG: prolipoprotein diacylglyceryl transferase [Flavobacteriaceae bacterium]|jgi:prolipoprotein diacylglyceryltransferase|nr:prolipoprotein diacylglyceryl transferase [Flavobacteriaceae bacterium]